MKNSFFDTLSANEKQQIKQRITTLVVLLKEWTEQYPSIHKGRIPASAMTSAVILQLPITKAFVTAKLILLVFSLDDLADERTISLETLKQKIGRWNEIASGSSIEQRSNFDELDKMLFEIKEDLSSSSQFEPLRNCWSHQLCCLVKAMTQEYQYGMEYSESGAACLPLLKDYLACGIHSIGCPILMVTVCILLDDPSITNRIEPILRAVESGSASVRFFNDFRSFERETQENNVNSVLIMYYELLKKAQSQVDADRLLEAKQHILQLADDYKEECEKRVQQIQTDSGQIEEIILRLATFASHLYGNEKSNYDYHTISVADIAQWLC